MGPGHCTKLAALAVLVVPLVAGCPIEEPEPDPVTWACDEPHNGNRDYSELVLIDGGTFTMGVDEAPRTNASWPSGDERPPHAVEVGPYCMMKYEVTIQQYEDCVREGVCDPTGLNWEEERDYETVANHLPSECTPDLSECWDYAVNAKTYFQATEYCEWTGGRLCTEAEWEFAAKGPTDRRWDHPWGNDDPTYELTNIPSTGPGWVEETWTHEAGDSPLGIRNMAGNVYEWVYDAYDLYAASDADNPQVDPVAHPESDDDTRIGRGSCFFTEPIRSATERTMWPATFDWG